MLVDNSTSRVQFSIGNPPSSIGQNILISIVVRLYEMNVGAAGLLGGITALQCDGMQEMQQSEAGIHKEDVYSWFPDSRDGAT